MRVFNIDTRSSLAVTAYQRDRHGRLKDFLLRRDEKCFCFVNNIVACQRRRKEIMLNDPGCVIDIVTRELPLSYFFSFHFIKGCLSLEFEEINFISVTNGNTE